MPRAGDGNMALSGPFAVASTVPLSPTINSYIEDLCIEMTDSVSRSGKGLWLANINAGAHKLTNMAAGTVATDAVNLSQLNTFALAAQGATSSTATTVAGTADAIQATFTPPFTAYATNMQFIFKASGPNTVTAPTINVDALGNKTIKRQGGVALAPYDIPFANYICECFYDGTDVILLNRNTTPSGTILDFAGATAPPGYLLCDGATVLRATYAALFAAITTTYGAGDGSTTFLLPDCRGRASIGAGTGTGLSARTLGGKPGVETHTLGASEIPNHTHSYGTLVFQASSVEGGSGRTNWITSTQNTGGMNESGGGQPHNNMQPSINLNKIIKT
jgi:microcystin-dependent protein